MKRSLLSFAAGVALAGCATPHVVEEKQVGDDSLTCAQIEAQIADAERFKKKARDEKGVTGTNAAALLLFWPALIATYSNVEEAVDAANERKLHLQKIYSTKGCSGAAASSKETADLNAKLRQLSELHKQGALTDDEFAAAKKKLLGL